MKINIFPIVSSLHSTNVISKNTLMLLEELKSLSNHEFNIVDIDSLYDADLSLILIQSGGSEQLILDHENYSLMLESYENYFEQLDVEINNIQFVSCLVELNALNALRNLSSAFVFAGLGMMFVTRKKRKGENEEIQ